MFWRQEISILPPLKVGKYERSLQDYKQVSPQDYKQVYVVSKPRRPFRLGVNPVAAKQNKNETKYYI